MGAGREPESAFLITDFGRTARRVWRYVRYDFPEMVLPSSLPDAPDVARKRKLMRQMTLRQHLEIWRATWTEYRSSFRDLLPDKRAKETEEAAEGDASASDEGAALKQEAAAGARSFAVLARPWLREMYETRAGAYRDGLREFVLGYREAFRDTLLQEAARMQQEAADARAGPEGTRAGSGGAAQTHAQAGGAPSRPADVQPDATQGGEPPRTPGGG